MTEQGALMRAIVDSPGEDAPRLVYADWLEDHGEPGRARFIRRGVAANSVMFFSNIPRRAQSRGAGRQLDRWLLDGPSSSAYPGVSRVVNEFLPPPLGKASCRVTFWRGFVIHVQSPLRYWLAHGRAITSTHVVESVHPQGSEPRELGGGRCYFFAPTCLPNPPDPYELPHEIFCQLVGGRSASANPRIRIYETAASAFADLKAACLVWGKMGPPEKLADLVGGGSISVG